MAFLNKTGLERLWAHVISQLGHKVEKVDGKGLSTNDFTNEEKEKLANLSTEGLASEEYVDNAVSVGVANLVNSAPETLDTLGEIATALEENADVVDALNSAIGNKVDKVEGMGLMPEADGTWKHLVTDGEGNKKWDERLAWKVDNTEILAENVSASWNTGQIPGTHPDESIVIAIEPGKTYRIYGNAMLGGVDYAFDGEGVADEYGYVKVPITEEYSIVASGGYGLVVIIEGYDFGGNFVINIATGTKIVKKINEEYLPESVPVVSITNSDEGKLLGVENGVWAAVENNSVLYTEQTLAEDQQSQARTNIGIDYATDEEVLAAMIEADIIPAIETENGALLSSAENTILIM